MTLETSLIDSALRNWRRTLIARESSLEICHKSALGKPMDARSDLFSFGVTLYEMATGKMPFQGDTTGILFLSIVQGAPVPAMQLNPDIPDELQRFIGECLEKDRELRYQHVHSGFLQAAPQDPVGLAQASPGVTRFRVTFSKPGIYPYICALHDGLGMKGKVVVLP